MSDSKGSAERARILATLGTDFSRWPEQHVGPARAALLSDPLFRRAWDAERNLDRALAAHRGGVDREIEGSGAAERIARRMRGRFAAAAFGGLAWQKMAAAMLVAGALGGAMDLIVSDQAAEASEFVALDPFLSLDDIAL